MSQVAIVTGASRGIGRAVAVQFADQGIAVAAFGRSREHLDQLKRDIGDRAAVSLHVADVADVGAMTDEIARAAEVHGGLDVLVNNAGTAAFAAPIQDVTLDVWRRTIDVNLTSVLYATQAAVPFLRDSPVSSIVNVSSVHALATAADVAPYAASKGAVVSLTRSMAIDLAAFGIRVVGILPGATDTEMLEEYAARKASTYEELGFALSATEIGRVMGAEEVARVIVFAALPSGSALNGVSVPVDAGLTARL